MIFAIDMMLKGLCSGSISKYRNKQQQKTWRRQVENVEKMKKFVDSIFFVTFWLDLGRFPYLEVYSGP